MSTNWRVNASVKVMIIDKIQEAPIISEIHLGVVFFFKDKSETLFNRGGRLLFIPD